MRILCAEDYLAPLSASLLYSESAILYALATLKRGMFSSLSPSARAGGSDTDLHIQPTTAADVYK
jgi:hypothetical protein